MMVETPIWDDMLTEGYADEYAHALELKDKITEAENWEPEGPEDDHWADDGRVGTEPSVHTAGVGSRTDSNAGGADADDAAAGVSAGGERTASDRGRTATSAKRKGGTPRRTRSKAVGHTDGDDAAGANDTAVRPSTP